MDLSPAKVSQKRLAAPQHGIVRYPPRSLTIPTRTGSNPIANLTNITLVDAGETLNNIPFEPLLVRQRKVDVILAFDNSA